MKTVILMRAEKQLENYVNKHGYDYFEGISYVKEVSGSNAILLWETTLRDGMGIEIKMRVENNEIIYVEEKKNVLMGIKL